ncbi:DUF4184 family protein [Microbacterium sp. P07]|uniref:DUF4184 family protein n=1 Tax=Microbacterium sp. P07 TaxID=3366952 RepID=UPI0037464BE3
MPFTLSHAVVALPFVRTPLIPAAIAVGAMTPDLPLFIRTGLPLYDVTHDAVMLPVTMVLALALLLVWRCVLRPSVGELTPRWFAARLPAAWESGPGPSLRETFAGKDGRVTARSAAILAISLLLGVLSHIVWDLFTHEGRGGVALLPALADPWGVLPGYKWLQHGSSVIALLVLGVWAMVWLRRRRPEAVERMLPAAVRYTVWLSLPAVLVGAWVIGLSVYGPMTDEWTPQHLAYRVLPTAVGVWGLSVFVLAAVVTTRGATSAPRR